MTFSKKLMIFGIASAFLIPLFFPIIFTGASAALTLNQMGIAIILAVSYNLLLGKTGLLSLGHAAYFGFGGFFAVHVFRFAALGDSWITVPILPLFGGVMGLVGAVALGSFTTKRGGLIFAMLSFAMAELVLASSTVFGRFYGGSLDRTEFPTFMGQNFQSDTSIFYIVWGWVALSIGICALFNASPLGRMVEAVGQNSERVEYIGYDQQKLKYLTFCLSGFIAGIAGGLFALAYEFVTVEIISLQQSWLILQMVFIGGAGFFWGPPVGAVLLTLLFSGLNGVTDNWNLYAGIVFICIVLFAPKGITGIISTIFSKIGTDNGSEFLKAYAHCLIGILLTIVGLVGLCEMFYFIKNPQYSAEHLVLFGLGVDPFWVWSWGIFGLLLIFGVWTARKAGHNIAELH